MNRFKATFLLGLSLAAAGCDPSGEPSHSKKTPAETPVISWPATRQTDGGSYSVTVNPVEQPIERNRHFSLTVAVEGGGEDNIKVSVGADMPAHRHGMNTRPEISETDDRRHRVDGMLFHMAGDWVITVNIAAGSKTEQAAFPVSIE